MSRGAIARWEAAWALSASGTWVFAIVLALYAYYEHGPAGVALAVTVRMLPAAMFAWLPRAFARWRSRRVGVLISAIVRFLALEAIALAATLEAPFALLLALAAVFEVASLLHLGARRELVLDHASIPADLAALGRARTITWGGFLAGALLSGVIVVVVSLHAAFAVAGLAFLPVALIAWRMPSGFGGTAAEQALEAKQLAGFRAALRRPWLRLRVGLFGAAVLVESTLDLLLVVVALDLVHVGDGGVGWLRAAFALGGLLAGMAALRSLRSGRLAAGAVFGLALAGVPLALVPAWPAKAPTIVLIGLLGAGYALLESSLQPLMHRLALPDAGAASSLEQYVYPLARAAGAGLGAWMVTQFGDRTAVVVAGVILPAIAIAGVSSLRAAERSVSVPGRALELLSRLPLVEALPAAAIENLALSARPETYPAGHTILRAAESGDRLYVIDGGEVECLGDAKPPRRLGPGSCFGQSAILRASEPQDTIRASAPLSAWTIARSDFVRST